MYGFLKIFQAKLFSSSMSKFVCRKDGEYCEAHGGAPTGCATVGAASPSGACGIIIGSGGGFNSFAPVATTSSGDSNEKKVAVAETPHFYRIGTPGKPWGDGERAAWLADVGVVQRSYADEVLAKIESLKGNFDVMQYGALSQNPTRYPLFCIKTKGFDPNNGLPCVLVTGGVHGYEKSGVQGALLFAATQMKRIAAVGVNIIVCPCVSPWGYECIQRWTAKAIDPNRSFFSTAAECPTEETAAVVALIASLGVDKWAMHIDCHETTDTDDSEFRPAKASRDGTEMEEDGIPDGFYLVGDSLNPQPEWHAAMIEAVRAVTHIAPPDAEGKIIGAEVKQEGVIHYPAKELHLCSSVTNADYCTTTEVYPDSVKTPVTDDQCNRAQVACVVAGLEFVLASMKKD